MVTAFLVALRGRRALRPAVCVVTVLSGFVAQVQYDTARLGAIDTQIVLNAAGCSLAALVVLMIGYAVTSHSRVAKPGSATITICVLIFAGIVRAVPVNTFELDPNPLPPVQRILQAAALTVVFGSVLSLVFDQVRRYRVERSALDAREQQLSQIRVEAIQTLAEHRQRLQASVNDRVVPAIRECLERLQAEGDLPAIAARLRVIASAVARPMTAELQNAPAPVIAAPTTLPAPASLTPGELVRIALRRNPIHPVLTAGFVFLVVCLVSRQLSAVIVFAAISALLSGAVLWLASLILDRGMANAPLPARALVAIAAFVASSLMAVAASWPPNANVALEVKGRWTLLLVLAGVVAGCVISLLAAAVRENRERLARQRAVVAAIAFEVNRITEEAQRINTYLAHIVHTDVQGLLNGAALRLEAAAGKPDEQRAVADVETVLEQLLAELQGEPAQQHTLREALNDLIHSWRNLVAVNVKAKDRDLARLDAMGSVANTVVDLAGEAVANAAKHGAANQVTIAIQLDPKDQEVRLAAIDDGYGLRSTDQDIQPGHVLDALQRAGGTWHLEPAPTGGTAAFFSLPAVTTAPTAAPAR